VQQKHINFRISNELKAAFDRFADEHFGGSVSDAGRFIFTEFFHPNTSSDYLAALVVYHNLMPQLHQVVAGIGARAEKEFREGIRKALKTL